jgi:predicted oxidoreductase
MEMIKIPHTDLEVSVSRWAAWAWMVDADTVLTSEHDEQARAFLDAADEIGVNFFDHANIYGRGRSEEVFGRVLRERPSLRDRIIIQSKCGIRWENDPPGTPQRFDFSRDHILESVDAILARLAPTGWKFSCCTGPTAFGREEIADVFQSSTPQARSAILSVSNQNRFRRIPSIVPIRTSGCEPG